MQQTFNLRKFMMSDLKRVKYINHLCLPENYTDNFFVDLHHRFPETFIVAEEDKEIVGYIMCRIETGLSIINFHGLIKKGHIVSVAVLPEYRRKGLGQALVNEAMENMKLYKVKQCYLEVRKSNMPAIDLYKNLDFNISRTIRGYYADGEDAYLMTKEISSD
ncbi:MAG: ribosomal protein S18-alanine N-acetyltransferase [Candidatus Bathyarchaeota archaeon]